MKNGSEKYLDMVNALYDDSKTTNMMEKLFAKDPITFYHSQRVGHLPKNLQIGYNLI